MTNARMPKMPPKMAGRQKGGDDIHLPGLSDDYLDGSTYSQRLWEGLLRQ